MHVRSKPRFMPLPRQGWMWGVGATSSLKPSGLTPGAMQDGENPDRAANVIDAIINDERRHRHRVDGLCRVTTVLVHSVATGEKIQRVDRIENPLSNGRCVLRRILLDVRAYL